MSAGASALDRPRGHVNLGAFLRQYRHRLEPRDVKRLRARHLRFGAVVLGQAVDRNQYEDGGQDCYDAESRAGLR